MKLYQLIFTENDCYKAGNKIKPTGIMVHSTAANNPELRRYVGPDDGRLGVNIYGNHWNQPMPKEDRKCVHAFIGKLKDGSIATYQVLPWDHLAWHCAGAANNTHISFEICEDNLKDAAYFGKVYQEAVELCAYLCKLYNLTEKDIIDHSEGAKRGIASGHSDVSHWFPKHGKNMTTFRADVKAKMEAANKTGQDNNETNQSDNEQEENEMMTKEQIIAAMGDQYIHTFSELPDWAKPEVREMLDAGFINGGTTADKDPDDINMMLSDIRVLMVAWRMRGEANPEAIAKLVREEVREIAKDVAEALKEC